MRTAPEGLRSVVLDSVAPPHIPTYDTIALPYAESFEAIFDQCAADAGCAAAYPNLKARFWALYSKLAKEPITRPAGKIDGDALAGLADRRNDYKNQAQGLTGYVPKLIAELE